MGNSIKKGWNHISAQNVTADSELGEATECPICGRKFPASSTYFLLNSHIDSCQGKPHQFKGGVSTGRTKGNLHEKANWLRGQLDKKRIDWRLGCDWITVDRSKILEESLSQIYKVNLRKEIKIKFVGELSQDAGGMIREWMSELVKVLLAPTTGLFERCDTHQITYKIKESSALLAQSAKLFCFMGMLVGKSLFDRIPLNLCLSRNIFKYLASESATLDDIQYLDESIYNSLLFVKECNVEKEGLEEYFVVSQLENGKEKIIELKFNGRAIPITEKNKQEYINLRANWMCYTSVARQLDAFATGFFKIIPKDSIANFSGEELEGLICGSPTINISDWKKNTLYNYPYNEKHKIILWFWKALNEYTQEELANFVKFCTGTSRVPIQGFAALESNRGALAKFTIHSMTYHPKESPYPRAHTCFNRLLLPLYPSYEKLKKGLDFIVKNEVTGFGID